MEVEPVSTRLGPEQQSRRLLPRAANPEGWRFVAGRASYPPVERPTGGLGPMRGSPWTIVVSGVLAALAALPIGLLAYPLIGRLEPWGAAAIGTLALLALSVLFVHGASGLREAAMRGLGVTVAVSCWFPVILFVQILEAIARSGQTGVDTGSATAWYLSLGIPILIGTPCLSIYLILQCLPRLWAWLHEA
jgi:hypothetical protein